MQQFVFKPKRKVDGKTVLARCFSGRYKLVGDSKQTTVSLGVTDKRVAQMKLAKIVESEQLRRAGLDVSGSGKLGEKIEDLLNRFCDDLERRGRDQKYIADVRRFVRIVSAHAGWEMLGDVAPEGFLNWRRDNGSKAPKTLNEYLNAWNVFLNWLVQSEFIPLNRLAKISKAETRGNEKRKRRVLTLDELQRLIVAAPEDRALNYLAAAYTGLRAGELASVKWGDVRLDDDPPHIIVRADSSKNKQTQAVPLHRDLVGRMKEKLKRSADKPFSVPKRAYIFIRKDLEAAGILYKDENGEQADFHALRHAFATYLQAGGANQAVAMSAMRHSDPKLTAVTYAHAALMPVAEAVANLPSIVDPDYSQIRTHEMVAEGHGVSSAVAEDHEEDDTQGLQNDEERCDLSQDAATGRKGENGSCGWIAFGSARCRSAT